MAWQSNYQTRRSQWIVFHIMQIFTRALKEVRKALQILRTHAERVARRWTSTLTNRLEEMNGLLQAARARARGYRNDQTFITMIYMIGHPTGIMFKST